LARLELPVREPLPQRQRSPSIRFAGRRAPFFKLPLCPTAAVRFPRPRPSLSIAAVDEKHAEVDGIAAPAANSGRHQRPGGLVRRNWRRRAGEVANARGKDRKTDEDQGAGNSPVDQVACRNGERPGQQAIRGEAQQKSGENKKRRPRSDARGSGTVHVRNSLICCRFGLGAQITFSPSGSQSAVTDGATSRSSFPFRRPRLARPLLGLSARFRRST